MNTSHITVTGMTCGCCADSVRDELGRIPGVTAVTVDLGTGAVGLDSAVPLDRESIGAAVTRAGYSVAE
ncbi:MAG: heavy-metal-associated domain-containing protein [Nocardia sp.]|nr:heavy-metal-associated domain-containing protein [Nocardia sp.]